MGHESDLVAARFARGCRCFAVVVDDRVGGYGWLSTNPEWISELQLEIHPRPGEGYVWNCATIREHRRKGIFRALLIGISEAARRDGLTRLWIGSVAIPAEKAVGPSGFRPALRFTTATFAGFRLLLVNGLDPDLANAARGVLGTRSNLYLGRILHRRH